MTVQVARFAQITPQARVEILEPSAAPTPPVAPRLRRVGKRIWHLLVVAISGPGLGEEYWTIDESAMPSGFKAPYGRGSRYVRNLKHALF